jgi:hypothetical protein
MHEIWGGYRLSIRSNLLEKTVAHIPFTHFLGSVQYLPSLELCAENTSQLIGKVYFIPVFIEVVLVVLQLFHAYRHTRLLTISRLPITPLLRTLYADGFAYFVVVLILRLWSGFLVRQEKKPFNPPFVSLWILLFTTNRNH